MSYPTEQAQLELISTARQLLHSDYTRRCTEEYRMWSITNQNNVNRVGEVLLRYPPFSGALSPLSFRSTIAKPTEDDVVKKALELYNRERPSPYQNSVPAVVDPISDPIVDTALATTPAPAIEMAGSTQPQSFAVSTQVAPAPLAVEPEPQVVAIESAAIVAPVEPVAAAAPTPVPVSESSFTDKILEIFKKPSEISTPPATTPEPDPLQAPVVVTESTDTRTDYTVEVPAVEIPEPAVLPQLTNENTSKIESIFKDVPKPTGITGLIRRAFLRKESNTGDTP